MANGETHDVLEPRGTRMAGRSFGIVVAVIAVTALGVVLRLSAGIGDGVGQPEAAGQVEVASFPSLAVTATTVVPVKPPPTTVAGSSLYPAISDGEVTPASFRRVDYSWQRVELASEASMDLVWLGELDDAVVAVAAVWDGVGSETLASNRSTDGVNWETVGRQELPENAFVSHAVGDGEHLYVFAGVWEGEFVGSELLLYETTDGTAWTEQPLDLGAAEDEFAYLQSVAAGPAGMTLAATFETYPNQVPLLDFGDIQVKLDYRGNTYQVIEPASGSVLLSGPIDELLPGVSADGLAVYDPDSGEVIVTIPPQVWDAGFSYYGGGGSPLPIPVSATDTAPPDTVSIGYDGFVIAVNEVQSTYQVTDAATGDEIASGTLNDLYHGPAPRLVDPETGEVLLDVTWDRWFAAEDRANRVAMVVDPADYTSRTELLTSNDGLVWTGTAVPGADGSYVSALLPTDTGFMAWVHSFGDSRDQSSVWTLEDGAWSSMPAGSSDISFNEVAGTSSGYVAVGDGQVGSGVWSSVDGLVWVPEFAIPSGGDGFYDYVTDVATDAAGNVAVLVTHEVWSDRPLDIEKDGYTLTFQDTEATVLTVTDSASGEVVLSLGWGAFESGRAADIVTWDRGVTSFDLGNGDILTITDDEAYAAIDWQWAGPVESAISVFLNEDGHWVEAVLPEGAGLGGAGQLLLVDGKLVIAGIGPGHATSASEPGSDPASLMVLVGTPPG
ncbi:MAG: hypothetical protein WBV06_10515 [Acidimicrobiia bacterium]